MDVTGTAGGTDRNWSFLVTGGGYRAPETGRTDMVVRFEATNRHPAGALTHYPFYELVIDDEVFWPVCFQVVDGEGMVGPGAPSEALVGFTVSSEPPTTFSLDIDSSDDHYRVDVTPATTGG